MSLSDCPKCWDTPCTCGYMGYTTVWHKNGKSLLERLEKLEKENAELKEKLRLSTNKEKMLDDGYVK